MPRKNLSDILRGGGSGDDWINDDWSDIPPAPNFGSPIPKGQYVTHIIDGELFNAQKGTPGYKLTFEVIEGEHRDRRLWYDIWLTAGAKRGAVRDLTKLGVKNKQQLEKPLPPRQIRCRVFVVIHKGDDGIERNVVKSFEVLGIDPPEQDAFAPKNEPSEPPDGAEDEDESPTSGATESAKPIGNGTPKGELFPFGTPELDPDMTER